MTKISIKDVNSGTWLRTISLAFALFNQLLAFLGKDQLPFTEDTLYQFCSLTLTMVTSIIVWWKNNSFTKEAIEADKILDDLKNDKQNVENEESIKEEIVEDKTETVEENK